MASRALVAVAARSLARLDDVTVAQFRALVVLTRADAVTVGDLAEELDIHPSTATRLCDRLVRKRLIRRAPQAASDRRVVRLSLTAAGGRLVNDVTERRRTDLTTIVTRMSPAQRGRAIHALRAFSAAAGEGATAGALAWVDGAEVTAPSPRRAE